MRFWVVVLLLCGGGARAQEPVVAAPAPVVEDKPLPPVAELLDAVEKHEDQDDAVLQQYTFHRHVVREDFDGKNAVKKTTTEDYESIPVEGVRVNKLVARDGKPLPPDEAKKEDERFDKEVDEAKKRKAKFEAKKDEAEEKGKSNDEFLPASRILQLGTFSNERRIVFNGRPTIVMDYAGNHDAKTKTEQEKIVKDLVGRVWIDEEDKVIARAEGHFDKDFKVGLGLVADIHQGLSFTMEQQKVNGEVWLTKSVDGLGKASFGLVLVRVNGHMHAEMSDYRKFRTTVTIVGSNGEIGADGKPVEAPK